MKSKGSVKGWLTWYFYWISHEVPWKVERMAIYQSKSLTTPENFQPSKPHTAYATDSSAEFKIQGGTRRIPEGWMGKWNARE